MCNRYSHNKKAVVKCYYSDEFDLIHLYQLEVSEKRKGTGREIVSAIIAIARKHNKNILVLPYQIAATPVEEVQSFYESLGFEPWQNDYYLFTVK